MEILNQGMEIRSDDPGMNNGKAPGFSPIESNPFLFSEIYFLRIETVFPSFIFSPSPRFWPTNLAALRFG